jgi:hypothetical protein
MDDRGGRDAEPGRQDQHGTSPQISTLGIWKLTFKNATKLADAAKGMVYVTIEKFEKGTAKVEKAHIHYDGDMIGSGRRPRARDPTSKHRVSNEGQVDRGGLQHGRDAVSVNPVNLPSR